MKQILFYILLVSQVALLLFLVFELEQIDEKGEEIKLETIALGSQYNPTGDASTAYVEYEINQITPEQWQGSREADYNDRVYILLTLDEDKVAHVKKASLEKLTAENKHEVVVIGSYRYHDSRKDIDYVDYGFETIKQLDRFNGNVLKQKSLITLLLGKWGQSKVIQIEKAD